MKKIVTILFVSLMGTLSLQAQMQYKIQFNYDSAGNQTQRDRVCINCGASKQATDSIPVVEAVLDSTLITEAVQTNDALNDPLENTKNSGLVAHPNPVTDMLTVEWPKSGNPVQQIVLFSGVYQKLAHHKIGPYQQIMALDFSNYPAGMYIVMVVYADTSKQSFQVLKK